MSGMSEYGTAFQRWVNGEYRTDGWMSDWQIEQLRRRAEDAANPRPYVKTSKAPEPRARSKDAHRSTRHGSRKCEMCETIIRKDNKTGRCIKHKPFIQPAPRGICPYTGCGNPLNHKHVYGICKKHYEKFKGLLKQTALRVCAEPGCFNALIKSCRLTKCRKHSKAERKALENARMRKVRAELKEAA